MEDKETVWNLDEKYWETILYEKIKPAMKIQEEAWYMGGSIAREQAKKYWTILRTLTNQLAPGLEDISGRKVKLLDGSIATVSFDEILRRLQDIWDNKLNENKFNPTSTLEACDNVFLILTHAIKIMGVIFRMRPNLTDEENMRISLGLKKKAKNTSRLKN